MFEIVVVDTSYCSEIESFELHILPEKVLTMKREPDNQYVEFAISIYCENVKVGYVPSEKYIVCSRLMDAGKLFFYRVVTKKCQNTWFNTNAIINMIE